MLPASTSSPGPSGTVTPAMAARARNSVTDSVATGWPASPGTAMGCTGHTHSGSMSSGMRLVTRTRRSAGRPASCSQARRADSSTCSQLSMTSSVRPPDTAPATASSPAAASAPLIPTASTRAATTCSSVRHGTRSAKHASSARPAATSIHPASTASAVFPTPPTPVSVTTACRASRAAISPRSAVLPTKDDRLGGSRTAGPSGLASPARTANWPRTSPTSQP